MPSFLSLCQLNSKCSNIHLNAEENLSGLRAFCKISLYISYLVANSSHTKPCCYLLLDFVPSMLLFFCGQIGILLHLLLQPPTRSDQLHSTQILYLLHVRQQCKSQKDISLNRSDCKRSSWWTISKPRNHFFLKCSLGSGRQFHSNHK